MDTLPRNLSSSQSPCSSYAEEFPRYPTFVKGAGFSVLEPTLSALTAPHAPALSAEVAGRAEGGVERLEVPNWCPGVDTLRPPEHGKAMEMHRSHGPSGETNRETVL